MNFYKDCFVLMDTWSKEQEKTTSSLCAIYIPFRDKYRLTDSEAIMIARNNMSPAEILKIGQRFENK